MSDLVGTQIVGFLTHRLIFGYLSLMVTFSLMCSLLLKVRSFNFYLIDRYMHADSDYL